MLNFPCHLDRIEFDESSQQIIFVFTITVLSDGSLQNEAKMVYYLEERAPQGPNISKRNAIWILEDIIKRINGG